MRYLAFCLCLYPGLLLAQVEIPSAAPIEPISTPYLMKLTGGLLLVIGLIFAVAWAVKKLNLNQQSHNGIIRVVAGLSIGTRDRLLLLQIGEEQILLGLTPGRIEKLHTLRQPLDAPPVETAAPSFAGKLNRLMNQRKPT